MSGKASPWGMKRSRPDAVIVAPTYNECDNVVQLHRKIAALGRNLLLLIVDDNSPDGTGEIADRLAQQDPASIQVLHRPAKLGLGSAYRAGFNIALDTAAPFVFTMDADLSHSPADIPALLDLADRADVVIGSRYAEGGGIEDWGFVRRWLSRTANQLARVALGTKVRDITTGFRCYRREVLETLDLESMRANGYSALIEMLFLCERSGFRVVEHPIVFTDRQRGRSKISLAEIVHAIGTLRHIAAHRRRSRSAEI